MPLIECNTHIPKLNDERGRKFGIRENRKNKKFSFVNNYSARAKLLILNIDASIMLPTSRIYFNSKCLDSIQIKMNCYVTNRVHYTTKSRLKEKLLASFFT